MALAHRHVRKSWADWIDYHHIDQVWTLCNKRGTNSSTGIPGVTQQANEVAGEPGWCPVCIDNMVPELLKNIAILRDHPAAPIDDMYNRCMEAINSFYSSCFGRNCQFDS